jgi:DNA-binding MarR family transcriptional regulator
MLQRARCGVDLRKQIVTLTPASQALVDVISPLIERQYALIEQTAGRQLLTDAAAVAQRLQQALQDGVPSVMDERAPVPGAAPQRE